MAERGWFPPLPPWSVLSRPLAGKGELGSEDPRTGLGGDYVFPSDISPLALQIRFSFVRQILNLSHIDRHTHTQTHRPNLCSNPPLFINFSQFTLNLTSLFLPPVAPPFVSALLNVFLQNQPESKIKKHIWFGGLTIDSWSTPFHPCLALSSVHMIHNPDSIYTRRIDLLQPAIDSKRRSRL